METLKIGDLRAEGSKDRIRIASGPTLGEDRARRAGSLTSPAIGRHAARHCFIRACCVFLVYLSFGLHCRRLGERLEEKGRDRAEPRVRTRPSDETRTRARWRNRGGKADAIVKEKIKGKKLPCNFTVNEKSGARGGSLIRAHAREEGRRGLSSRRTNGAKSSRTARASCARARPTVKGQQ